MESSPQELGFFASILRFLTDFVSWVMLSMQKAVCWFLQFMLDTMLSFLGLILDALPSSWVPNMTEAANYGLMINSWVPLDYGMTLLAGYWTFMGVFIVTKMVLKIIPSIG